MKILTSDFVDEAEELFLVGGSMGQVAAERTRWVRAPFRRSGGTRRQVGSGSAFIPIPGEP